MKYKPNVTIDSIINEVRQMNNSALNLGFIDQKKYDNYEGMITFGLYKFEDSRLVKELENIYIRLKKYEVNILLKTQK